MNGSQHDAAIAPLSRPFKRIRMETVPFNLPQDRIPFVWYNILPDLPKPPVPSLHPGTLQLLGLEDLAPLFPNEPHPSGGQRRTRRHTERHCRDLFFILRDSFLLLRALGGCCFATDYSRWHERRYEGIPSRMKPCRSFRNRTTGTGARHKRLSRLLRLPDFAALRAPS